MEKIKEEMKKNEEPDEDEPEPFQEFCGECFEAKISNYHYCGYYFCEECIPNHLEACDAKPKIKKR